MVSVKSIVRAAPPAWTLYPFLGMFFFACVANGAYQSGLKAAVLENQRVIGVVNAVVQAPPSATSLRILASVRI